MKNLYKLFNECTKEVKDAGIKYGNIVSISINSRAKRRWGQAKKKNEGYYINISERLLQDDISDTATKDTIIHEILHTCDGCMNHGDEWQKMANIINSRYPQYHISRCTSYADKGLQITTNDYKYNVICRECGSTWNYNRAGKVIQNIHNFRCPKCGTHTLFVKHNAEAKGVLTTSCLKK